MNFKKIVNYVSMFTSKLFSPKKSRGLDYLFPFFQPILCGVEYRIVGLEILARVKYNKNRPAHFPSQLINEHTPLYIHTKITNELLRKTLLLISAEYFEALQGCHININISPLQIADKNTCNTLIYYAKKFSEKGYKLNVEITEEYKNNDYLRINDFISSLRSSGVDVYLDDYGKGYSSPLLFKNIIVSGVKIDRGFTHDLETSEVSRKFIQQTIELAKEKGVKVILEGVETEGQHRVISQLGVDSVQGFFYGKPNQLQFINKWYSPDLTVTRGTPQCQRSCRLNRSVQI